MATDHHYAVERAKVTTRSGAIRDEAEADRDEVALGDPAALGRQDVRGELGAAGVRGGPRGGRR